MNLQHATGVNAVLTSASRKVPMIEALKKAAARFHPDARVFAADSNADCLARYFADDFWQMPATDDEHFPIILNWLQEHGVRFVFPSRDGELMFWSRHAQTLADAGIHVMVSSPDIVDISLDKLKFPSACLESGIPAIPASEDARSINAEKLVVKERFGAGAKSIGLNLTHEEAIVHAGALSHPVFQPFISGAEISVDGYVDRHGACKGIVLRRRNYVVNGESQITTSFRNEALEGRFAATFAKLGIRGHAIMQAILDSEGNFHVIECNARFGGASTLSLAAGLDSFFWFMQEASGNSLDAYPFVPATVNLRQIRHAHDLIIHDTGF